MSIITYPKLEEGQFCLDQKELFINKLPYPLAKSYFCMINSIGQRRFGYFLELIESTLKFYYFIFAEDSSFKPLSGKLSLGQFLFSLENILKNIKNDSKLGVLEKGFKQNKKNFRKLIKLRNQTWGHGRVKTETDYDHYYLLNLSLLNQILRPLLDFVEDYFVVEEIVCFKKNMILIRVFSFLGFSPFGRRELISFNHNQGQLKKGQVFLKGNQLVLDLSNWQRFENCEVCHLDSFFIFEDLYKKKKGLIFTFSCVNCGSRRVIDSEQRLDK